MGKHDSKNTRPGKLTGIKPTAAEHERRVQIVCDLIGQGRKKHEIIHELCTEFGVHWRTSENYLVRAREVIIKAMGRSKPELRAEAVLFNEQIIRSPDTSTKEKQDSSKQLCELLGLYAPRTVEVDATVSSEITVIHSPIDVEEVIEPLTITNGNAH